MSRGSAPTVNAVVVGGFERSGHDSMAGALFQEGIERGHRVQRFNWRDFESGIGGHLLFAMHRQAGRVRMGNFAETMSDERIVKALTADLQLLLDRHFPEGVDSILSAHPWSTLALARWLEPRPGPTLVDCHSEFTPFPVFPHPRVNSFVGAGRPTPRNRQLAERLHVLGLPVRRSFVPLSETRTRDGTLVVNAGSDAWAIKEVAKVVPQAARLLEPSRVVLLAPTASADHAWRSELRVGGRFETLVGVTDIGLLLCASSWLVTKAGGTPIAEGLVAGCSVLAMATGIPWEDDGLSWLTSRGHVIPIGGTFPEQWTASLLGAREGQDTGLRSMLADSASNIWRHLELGAQVAPVDAYASIASELVRSSSPERPGALPSATAELQHVLMDWAADG